MATSGSFNTNSVGNFYFTISWARTSYNSTNNTHHIEYSVYSHNSAGSYRTVYEKSLTINSESKYYDTTGKQCENGTLVTSGSMDIPSYNAAGDGSIALYFEAGVGISSGSNCSGSGTWELDRIPRYANLTEHYIYLTGLNFIKIHWNADAACDWVQYSLNGGNWINTSELTYTISGLEPNTQYSIRTRIRRTDSGLWTESGYIYGTTKDIAKITSASNFNLGNNERIQYSNPSESPIDIALYKNNTQEWLAPYRSCSGNEYTFNFTDEELDRIYKAMGNTNSITGRIYLRTNYNYLDYQTVTITLTGNQKTGHVNVSGTWKRSKKWTNVSGIWKRCVRWVNVNGTWKRCI